MPKTFQSTWSLAAVFISFCKVLEFLVYPFLLNRLKPPHQTMRLSPFCSSQFDSIATDSPPLSAAAACILLLFFHSKTSLNNTIFTCFHTPDGQHRHSLPRYSQSLWHGVHGCPTLQAVAPHDPCLVCQAASHTHGALCTQAGSHRHHGA